ncbi:MAG: FAD-dependent oxidoreductase [Actinobacteria bacterium]|nr:FAD-dependent oxidoreductase [Actinomycetota bacterium]
MSAAHQALRTARAAGVDLRVVALERTAHTSYSACGIPYWVAGDVEDGDRLVARTAQEHRAAGIDLRLGVEAVALDVAARTVTGVDVATGARATWEYDDVLLATGAAPVVPPWALDADGRFVPGVRAVKDLDDGAAWVAMLDDAPRRGVVVGGGYIGLEMAEAFARKGLTTTLVTRREVMGTLDPDMGARVREAVERAGVTVRVGEDVGSLSVGPDGRVACVSAVPTGSGTTGSDAAGPVAGERFEGDVVALGLGARPRSELAVAAGVAVGDFGGVLTDDRQRALGPDGAVLPGVWAAGDCCEHVERHGGRRVYVPLGTHANKQGRVAGENIGRSAAGDPEGGTGGGPARFGGVLGTAITRFAANGVHVEIGRTGPTTQQALEAGRDVASLVTESTTASGYMPEASPIAVKVLAEKGSRLLLGLQIVGGPGSAKRVDTAAAAIWLHASVDDVAAMDLSYAPPFSPVHDPVQIACRRLAERM